MAVKKQTEPVSPSRLLISTPPARPGVVCDQFGAIFVSIFHLSSVSIEYREYDACGSVCVFTGESTEVEKFTTLKRQQQEVHQDGDNAAVSSLEKRHQ